MLGQVLSDCFHISLHIGQAGCVHPGDKTNAARLFHNCSVHDVAAGSVSGECILAKQQVLQQISLKPTLLRV